MTTMGPSDGRARLVPYPVPWGIEASSANTLSVRWEEDGAAQISFRASRWAEGEQVYGMVSLMFPAAFSVRASGSLGRSVFDESEYVLDTGLEALEPAEWLHAYRRRWRESGLCPVPGFYRTLDRASWRRDRALRPALLHSVVVGDGGFVDVLHGKPVIIETFLEARD